jgi:uncharacterized lipoprotein
MYTTDRRALVIAILVGALALLLLSACGTPDSSELQKKDTSRRDAHNANCTRSFALARASRPSR